MHSLLRLGTCFMFPALISACNSETPRDAVDVDFAAAGNPQLFLTGVVSTEMPEFAITFAPDGQELYFNRTDAARSELKIMVSRRDSRGWSPATLAPFSGQYRDVDPFLTADGKRLYFSSDRPRAGTEETSFSTWYVQRTASGWSGPIDPGPPLNSEATDIYVSAARDGTLVFNSQRDGTNRVYISREIDGAWLEPQALQFGSVESAGNPRISPNGDYIVMVMVQDDSAADLFYSCKTAAGWLEPVELAAGVNSAFADFAPALDDSGETLYFTSERPGVVGPQPAGVRPPGDIYEVARVAAGIQCD